MTELAVGTVVVSYQPHRVVPMFAASRSNLKLAVKKAMATAQLSWISRTAHPQLSDPVVRADRLAQLQDRLERLKHELRG